MTKPLSATLPRWADTVAGDPTKVSEPAAGKKDIGWVVAEKPPAQWKNWLLLQTYNWLLWLDAFETEAHTWTKEQTFQQGTAATRAIHAIGNTSGEGGYFEGGSNAHGVKGQAYGALNYGVYGIGDPAGGGSVGVYGFGGLNGYGVKGQGGAGVAGVRGTGGTGGPGGEFVGDGAGNGITVTAGATGKGIEATGGATSGIGIQGTGGATSSTGVKGIGGTANGVGIQGQGTGSGTGVSGTGGATGAGGVFTGGGTSGNGVEGNGGPASYGGLLTGGTNKAGLRAVGGAGNAPGIEAIPAGNGVGIDVAGGGTGIAISASANIVTSTDVIAGTGALCTVNGSKVEFSTVTHPASTDSLKHQVRPINTARAWAVITTDGAGGVTPQDAAGIASVAITATTVEFTFADAFTTAGKYSVGLSGNGATFSVIPANKGTTVLKVTPSVDPTANVIALDIQVMGRQT